MACIRYQISLQKPLRATCRSWHSVSVSSVHSALFWIKRSPLALNLHFPACSNKMPSVVESVAADNRREFSKGSPSWLSQWTECLSIPWAVYSCSQEVSICTSTVLPSHWRFINKPTLQMFCWNEPSKATAWGNPILCNRKDYTI